MSKNKDKNINELAILKNLKEQIGKEIPLVNTIETQKIGVQIEDENIIGLSLFLTNLKNVPESLGNLTKLKILNLNYSRIKNLPETLKNLKELEFLQLGGNKLTEIPNVVENLTSLKELSLFENSLTKLPNFIEKLQNLQNLNLRSNQFISIPKPLLKLNHLQFLDFSGNYLTSIPDDISNLKNLRELILKRNKLRILPESIGDLKSLKRLILNMNQLYRLPDSIGGMESLESLDLLANRLENLPESLANLKFLKEIDLYGNAWKGEWKALEEGKIMNNLPTIFKLCRKLNGITIFISHAWDDQNNYKILDLEKNLVLNNIIHRVYICEKNLIGGIWEFMAENVPKSQLLLFIATQNSIKSAACKFELLLAMKYGVKILPVKGIDIEWEELNNIDLTTEGHGFIDLSQFEQKPINLSILKGIIFDSSNFNKFIQKINEYIEEHLTELKLSKKRKGELEYEKLNFKNAMKDLLASVELKNKLKENCKEIDKLFQEVSNNRISNGEYLSKLAQILTK